MRSLGIQVENEKQLIPLQVLQDNEDVWISNINRKSMQNQLENK